MLIRQPVVLVDGARAAALAAVLRHLERAGALDSYGERIAGELRRAAVELDAAGRAWLGLDVADEKPEKPFLVPNTAESDSPPGRGEGAEWLTAREAAELLGISPQGLRKSAASRDGQFIHGRWLFPRCTIDAELEQKQKAS